MKNFDKFLKLSILFVFLVILAGGIVRSTGAGLGCPDWPKCFGTYIPPTDISQLPANYKEVFKISGKTIADFDVFKTWTEYLNRLVGAIAGFIVLGMFIVSLKFKREAPKLTLLSLISVLLMGVQGWLGSVVVSSHLKPVIITAHMAFAIIIVLVLVKIWGLSQKFEFPRISLNVKKSLTFLTRSLLILSYVQVFLGTQVREQIDHAELKLLLPRIEWMSNVDWIFYIHRSFSVLIVICLVVLMKKLTLLPSDCLSLRKSAKQVLMAITISVFSGVCLNYFGFPAFAQPMHLIGSFFIVAYLYKLLIVLKNHQEL